MKLDDYSIGLRILDIEHGFRETRPDPVIQTEMEHSLVLGKALNLALHIRDLNVIEDVRGLKFAAAELGVATTELQVILDELEAIEWVRLKKSGRDIKRVEVLVPALRDGFEVVGARWRDLGPTEVEQASVQALADAVVRPYRESAMISDLGMGRDLAKTVIEIGDAGTYLRRHRLDDGTQIVYSPLFGDSHFGKEIPRYVYLLLGENIVSERSESLEQLIGKDFSIDTLKLTKDVAAFVAKATGTDTALYSELMAQ